MLTVKQEAIMQLLNDFKYLKRAQIEKYMEAKYGATETQLTKMFRQLVYLGEIRQENEFVLLPGREKRHKVIDAFEVAMVLTDGQVDYIYSGKHPFLLTFSARTTDKPPKSSIFSVIWLEPQSEERVCAKLEAVDRSITVIFILYDIEQKKRVVTAHKHYFAVENTDGKFKFFKGKSKMDETE